MQVTVQVSTNLSQALLRRNKPAEGPEAMLLRTVETLGLALEPMHRDTDDPDLQNYFIVEVPDNAAAQRVVDRLQQSEAVMAAYVKPPDKLP